jgi:hypothetical protein
MTRRQTNKMKPSGNQTTKTGDDPQADKTTSLHTTHKPLSRTHAQRLSTGDTTTKPGDTMQQKNEEPWLQQYTQWTFEQMHSQIYPIVEKILENKMHRDHPFRIKGRQLQGTGNKYPMTKNTVEDKITNMTKL